MGGVCGIPHVVVLQDTFEQLMQACPRKDSLHKSHIHIYYSHMHTHVGRTDLASISVLRHPASVLDFDWKHLFPASHEGGNECYVPIRIIYSAKSEAAVYKSARAFWEYYQPLLVYFDEFHLRYSCREQVSHQCGETSARDGPCDPSVVCGKVKE